MGIRSMLVSCCCGGSDAKDAAASATANSAAVNAQIRSSSTVGLEALQPVANSAARHHDRSTGSTPMSIISNETGCILSSPGSSATSCTSRNVTQGWSSQASPGTGPDRGSRGSRYESRHLAQTVRPSTYEEFPVATMTPRHRHGSQQPSSASSVMPPRQKGRFGPLYNPRASDQQPSLGCSSNCSDRWRTDLSPIPEGVGVDVIEPEGMGGERIEYREEETAYGRRMFWGPPAERWCSSEDSSSDIGYCSP